MLGTAIHRPPRRYTRSRRPLWRPVAGLMMQIHMGALRSVNTRRYAELGPDTGFDVISDCPVAENLSGFLDRLDRDDELPKLILYSVNAGDNDIIPAIIGAFQGGMPGKIQFGSGWWHNDQKDGMQKQMTSLANLGPLSQFVGMLTDSRSFLSFPGMSISDVSSVTSSVDGWKPVRPRTTGT